MDQWLDSLSEDWVSQPRSPFSDPARRSSSAISVVSHTSNTSQSRIPRYRPQRASNLVSNTAPSSRRKSLEPSDSGRNSVLKERSSSKLNIPCNRDSESGSHAGNSGAKRRIESNRQASTSSIPSVPQDTVQHRNLKASPTKENELASTPEWKRRVLQGKAGDTGPDLFGPIGLEGIFKPPTVGRASKSSEKQKRGKKYQPVQVDEFPSSPPAFPSDFGSVDRSGGTDRRRSSLLKQMDILEEVSEGDSRDRLPRIASQKPEEMEETPGQTGLTPSDSRRAEEDHNEVLSQVLLPKRPTHHQEPDFAAGQSQNPSAVFGSRTPEQASSKGHGRDRSSQASPSPPVPETLVAQASDWTSHSLPGDLSTGTDLYVANGGYVSVHRGGYSNEGSFHRRSLSPSSLPDFDAPELRSPSPLISRCSMRSRKSSIPEELSNQSRSAPVTPRRKDQCKSGSSDEPRSSGSPLKLFDKYDTFTNERLIRRISRFERSVHESEEEQSEQEPQPKDSMRTAKEKLISQSPYRPAGEPVSRKLNRRIDSFGAGQLDGRSFDAEHKYDSAPHPATNVIAIHSAKNHPEDTFRFRGLTVEQHGTEHINIHIDATETTNGKRLPHSPAKEFRAKRRRTLRSSEEMKLEIHQYARPKDGSPALQTKVHNNKNSSSQAADPPSSGSRSLAGKKRKDARYDNDSKVADPKILALRQILRPRTPTPSQKGTQQEPLIETGQTRMPSNIDQSDGAQSLAIDLDHQTQALAGELATFTLNMAQDMTQGARKASVTTDDFFNEAKQIMQLIRNRGRPQGSQTISEEEEPDEGDEELPQSQIDQSTMDEFSRPPSREGGSLRRLREPVQVDARVASHLRKFEDTDDLGLALPSSVKSMHIAQSHDPTLSPNKSMDEALQQMEFEAQSDPPNIRIKAQPQGQTPEAGISSRQDGSAVVTSTDVQSTRSESSGPSTVRSVPTGSSRGSRSSGTKAMIAPQVVSHLLSDNVGAMTFDHSRQIWIKRKGPHKPPSTATHSRSGSDVTEDLFKDIPDLSVDEGQEQQHIRTTAALGDGLGSGSNRISNHDHISGHPGDNFSSRPQTRDSAGAETVDQSSVPSRLSRFASSGPIPETRATSWGDEILARKVVQMQVEAGKESQTAKDDVQSEEVEHEISILEGRTSRMPQHVHQSQRQPRVVTVAFSSPLVDQVQFLAGDNDAAATWDDDSDLDLADSPIRDDARSVSASRRRTSTGFRKTSSYRNASRRASIGLARPMSRVDENEELTFLQAFHGPQNASMELIVTTPLPASRREPLPSAFSSAQASTVGFQLSPLSEFTVHKSDDLDKPNVRHVTKHPGLLATHEVEGPLSLAIQDLVKKLTDIEPYEPYWDHIRHLDLRNRNLQSLHMLDEYCDHLEDLDVSDNDISQLNGAPSWIRHLKACRNSLSNLTSWAHMRNLQYLDVSGNQIQNLAGFQSLVHLRELKANDNLIESLEGILELDGLITLTLRRNSIKAIDFEACNLPRLTDLDLSQNELAKVTNLDHLPGLKRLDLSNNSLDKLFTPKDIPRLQDLRLANNRLHALDVAQFPNLQLLNIDKNSVGEIIHLESHRSLEVLSWREQCLDSTSHKTNIQYQFCRSVRELYLSGNVLPSIAPKFNLLNLQILEAASTGLQFLADDFGVKCPNLRLLNLNFNALSELRPLLGIVRLEKLYLAGNRISRLRRTASVLERIGPDLTELDLRQNPLTLGYYIAQQQPQASTEQRLVLASKSADSEELDDTFDSLQNHMMYQLPLMEEGADDGARQRLDEDTKIRRRVYEMLTTLRCNNLRKLDGLILDRRKIAFRDGVWKRLRELGVIKDKVEKAACELEG
ncbi:MAG: hypothetical protein Q9225_002620 [Loekoesia sp. 1 TL-2023]